MFVLIVVKSLLNTNLRPNCYAVKLYQQEPSWDEIEADMSNWVAENIYDCPTAITREIIRNGFYCEVEQVAYTYALDYVELKS